MKASSRRHKPCAWDSMWSFAQRFGVIVVLTLAVTALQLKKASASPSQSVTRVGQFAPAKVGSCQTKLSYGIVGAVGADCQKLGGAVNGSPAASEWTACHLDWCADGSPNNYVAAKPGTCQNKLGYGIFKTTGAGCRRLGGAMNGNPDEDVVVDCHMDFCSSAGVHAGQPSYVFGSIGSCSERAATGVVPMPAMLCRANGGDIDPSIPDEGWGDCNIDVCFKTGGLRPTAAMGPAKVGSCQNKLGYGIISTTGADCRRLGGAMNGHPGDNQWTDCHLDWCPAKEASTYVMARPGSCDSGLRRAYGVTQMRAGECRAMGGGLNGNPADGEVVGCHLDYCAKGSTLSYGAGGLGQCVDRAAGMTIVMDAAGCRQMGGNPAAASGWSQCSLDVCYVKGGPPRSSFSRNTSGTVTPSNEGCGLFGQEEQMGICYPACRAGYAGVGPVCWEGCKSGYTDDGALCRLPLRVRAKGSYGRGAGEAMKPGGGFLGFFKPSEWHCPGNTEQSGALCYPRCRPGYKGVGPVCWGACGAGEVDDGALCRVPLHVYAKSSYGRGAGDPVALVRLLEKLKDALKGVAKESWGAIRSASCSGGFDAAFALGGIDRSSASQMGSGWYAGKCGQEYAKGFFCKIPDLFTGGTHFTQDSAEYAWKYRQRCLTVGLGMGVLTGGLSPAAAGPPLVCGAGHLLAEKVPKAYRCAKAIFDGGNSGGELANMLLKLGCNVAGSLTVDLIIAILSGGATAPEVLRSNVQKISEKLLGEVPESFRKSAVEFQNLQESLGRLSAAAGKVGTMAECKGL